MTHLKNEIKENEVINVSKKSLKEQEKEIIKLAEDSGVQSNYFFITTFQRYLVQLKILDELEKSIKDDGLLVEKEYVKGRKNVYSHPAISDYNRTTDSANKTVSTLMKIIKSFEVADDDGNEDPLMAAINGSDGDEE